MAFESNPDFPPLSQTERPNKSSSTNTPSETSAHDLHLSNFATPLSTPALSAVPSVAGSNVAATPKEQLIRSVQPAKPLANAWAARSQQIRRESSTDAVSTPNSSATMVKGQSVASRSLPRRPNGVDDPLRLDDVNDWPEVRDATPNLGQRIERTGSQGSVGVSVSRKEKTKWVHIPPSELQAAIDANRPARSQPSNSKSHSRNPSQPPSQSQSQSQSQAHSPTQSIIHSERSSPRNTTRGRRLPDDLTVLPGLQQRPWVPSFEQPRPQAIINISNEIGAPPPSAKRIRHIHHRPTPSNSKAVGGWTFDDDPPSPQLKPLFGSFKHRIKVNVTPPGGSALELSGVSTGDELDRPESPPSHPRGANLVKQPGKIGIGIHSDSNSSHLGKDEDGWFIVDPEASTEGGSPKWEFGRFNSPSPSPLTGYAPLPGALNGAKSQNNYARYPGNGSRAPWEEPMAQNGYTQQSNGYRGNMQGYNGNSTRRGGKSSRAGGSSFSGSRSGNGYPRAPNQNHGSHRPPPHHQPQYNPFEVTDPYAIPHGGDMYAGAYYMPPSSPTYPPPPFSAPYSAPYAPYGTPMGPAPNGGFGNPMMGFPPPGAPGVVPPPIPMPVTHLSFPLDPLRFYLLGQVEYYFSVQNLAADVFLRRQMDSEGWIDVTVIASFNRVRQLTQDVSLVRDTMAISSLVEVNGNKVRLAYAWENFVLPETPALSPSAYNNRDGPLHQQGIFPPYSHASNEDASSIQEKVTLAVLGSRTSIAKIGESKGEPDESSSNTTTGSLATEAALGFGTSPPSSLGSDEEEDNLHRLKPIEETA